MKTRDIDLSLIDFDSFYSKIQKTDQCWLWIGSKHPVTGYGSFYIKGKTYLAHRISFEKSTGLSSSGLCICHTCDNPLCVNPEHLFSGSRADNNRDRDAKNRNVKGSRTPWSKLTESDVLQIRALYHWSGFSLTQLCKEFSCSISSIDFIVKNKTWKHVRTDFPYLFVNF